MSQFFTSGGQSIGASASIPPVNILKPCCGHFCKQCGFNIDWFSRTASIFAPDPYMEDCQRGSVYEALILVIHVWHPLWLHAPSVSSEPTWWAWQLLPSTEHVLCLRIVGTCQTVGTSASRRQRWKLCVCVSPYSSPHRYSFTSCSCWGTSWGLLPSAKFKQKQVPITESLAEFLSLSYLLFQTMCPLLEILDFAVALTSVLGSLKWYRFGKWQCQNVRATGW